MRATEAFKSYRLSVSFSCSSSYQGSQLPDMYGAVQRTSGMQPSPSKGLQSTAIVQFHSQNMTTLTQGTDSWRESYIACRSSSSRRCCQRPASCRPTMCSGHSPQQSERAGSEESMQPQFMLLKCKLPSALLDPAPTKSLVTSYSKITSSPSRHKPS